MKLNTPINSTRQRTAAIAVLSVILCLGVVLSIFGAIRYALLLSIPSLAGILKLIFARDEHRLATLIRAMGWRWIAVIALLFSVPLIGIIVLAITILTTLIERKLDSDGRNSSDYENRRNKSFLNRYNYDDVRPPYQVINPRDPYVPTNSRSSLFDREV